MAIPIRQRAEKWLKREEKSINKSFRASKFYGPEKKGWKNVWWFEFEEKFVENSNEKFLHLLCQTDPNSDNFYHLKIPFEFLKSNKSHLGYRDKERRYSLILSAESKDIFRELRGNGKIDFAKFRQ